jgi:hypothetical protein
MPVVTMATAMAMVVAVMAATVTVIVMAAAMAMIVVPATVAVVIMATAMSMILVAATMTMVVMPASVMIAGSVGYGARHEKAAHSFGISGSAVENQRLQEEQHTDHDRVAKEKRSDEAPEPCVLIGRQM